MRDGDRFDADALVSDVRAGLGLPAGVQTLTIELGPVISVQGFEAPDRDAESIGRDLIAAAGLGPIESVERLPDGRVTFCLQTPEQPSNRGAAA